MPAFAYNFLQWQQYKIDYYNTIIEEWCSLILKPGGEFQKSVSTEISYGFSGW